MVSSASYPDALAYSQDIPQKPSYIIVGFCIHYFSHCSDQNLNKTANRWNICFSSGFAGTPSCKEHMMVGPWGSWSLWPKSGSREMKVGFQLNLLSFFCNVGSLTKEWYQHLGRVFQRHFIQSRDIFTDIPRSLSLGWSQDHPGIQLVLTIKDPIQQCWSQKIESLLYHNGFNAFRQLTFWWSVNMWAIFTGGKALKEAFYPLSFSLPHFFLATWTEQTP